MNQQAILEIRTKLNESLEHLKREVAGLRTGRATPALVEDLEVEYYGDKQPLKALSAISIPEPRQILITPWDKNAMEPIQKAIQQSNLGMNPIADSTGIRLTIPALNEERRRDLIKLLSQKVEEGRISVRRIREEAMKELDRAEKDKTVSKDDHFRGKDQIQKLVDETNKKIEELGVNKEKEIMTV
ncbi:MAG: ribosome recycling factor [Candidatus Sungbacteria bacterium]|uniref:Ribosome-recycling factor n=1 Tax=Candidatus Sungiibacteriota bacterium TaxID=2750080 RepID=A0A931SBT7_9BACT|nr:ribosome recycling factor [Candidatus Sungbacteria bacterium]